VVDRPSFDEYLASLGHLTAHVDPTAVTAASTTIKEAAASLSALDEINLDSLTVWASEHAHHADVLGLAVGLGLEKFKMALKHHLGTSGWVTVARDRPAELVRMLDEQYDLVRQVTTERRRLYDFGDIPRRTGGKSCERYARRPGQAATWRT